MVAFGAAQTTNAGGAQRDTLHRKIDDDERTFDDRRAQYEASQEPSTLVASAQDFDTPQQGVRSREPRRTRDERKTTKLAFRSAGPTLSHSALRTLHSGT